MHKMKFKVGVSKVSFVAQISPLTYTDVHI